MDRPLTAGLSSQARLVDVSVDDYPAWLRQSFATFGLADDHAQRLEPYFRRNYPPQTAIGAIVGSRYVATASAIELHLVLPGGGMAEMAGITLVSVDPTVTRQGLLRRMLSELHDRATADGRPVAGLVPSEWAIYGRFGYGPATWTDTMDVDLTRVTWRPDAPTSEDRPRRIDGGEARQLAAKLHRVVALGTPGDIVRSDAYWDRLVDETSLAAAALGLTHHTESTIRHVAVADRGYASYQLDVAWTSQRTTKGSVIVVDFLAVDNDAAAALWRHLFSLDLVVTARVPRVPIDHPLAWWVHDPRLLSRRRCDGLWLRPLNTPMLLESRRWSGTGSVILQVHDVDGYAGGTFRLDVDDGAPSCTTTSAEPDLIMDAATLGAIYLGGTSARELLASGSVSARDPKSALQWDTLAATRRSPFLSSSF